MGLFSDIKTAWTIKRLKGRLEDEAMKIGWAKALWAALMIGGPAAVGYFTEACPALFTVTGAVTLGGGVLAVALARHRTAGAGQSVVVGVGSAGLLSVMYYQALAEIGKLCGTGFVQQLPTILSTALALGVGAYFHHQELPTPSQAASPEK